MRVVLRVLRVGRLAAWPRPSGGNLRPCRLRPLVLLSCSFLAGGLSACRVRPLRSFGSGGLLLAGWRCFCVACAFCVRACAPMMLLSLDRQSSSSRCPACRSRVVGVVSAVTLFVVVVRSANVLRVHESFLLGSVCPRALRASSSGVRVAVRWVLFVVRRDQCAGMAHLVIWYPAVELGRIALPFH